MSEFLTGLILGRLLPLAPHFDQIGAGLLFITGAWLGHPRLATKHFLITTLIISLAVWWTFPLLAGINPCQCVGW